MADTRTRVLEEVLPVAERFVAAGYRIHLVGGIVRDLQLGASISDLDFDLTTDASPAEIRSIVRPMADAIWTQGERFGTIGFTFKGRPFEVTTNRAESYSSDSRKPAVRFGTDIIEDLSRRDFTVNAMAIDLPDGDLIDPFAGRAALEELRLETPIDPMVSFADDPLRILRASRFLARYGLEPTEDLTRAARALTGRLEIVSIERIRDEVDKLLAAELPSRGLTWLERVGALARIFVELGPIDVVRVGTQLDEADEVMARRLVILSNVPVARRREQLGALRYSNADCRVMERVLEGLDAFEDLDAKGWTDGEVRGLVRSVGHPNTDLLFAVASALGIEAAGDVWTQLEGLASVEDLSDLRPVLTGGDIIDAFGLDPGPAVGAAMAALSDRRVADGPLDAAGEIEWLRAQGFDRSTSDRID